MHWRWTGRDGCGHSSPWAIFGSSPAGVGIFAFGRHALCGGLRILGRYGSLRVMLGLARLRTSSLRWHSLLCRGLGFAVHPQVRVLPALSAAGWACCGGCGWGAVAHCMFLATRRPRRWHGGRGAGRCVRRARSVKDSFRRLHTSFPYITSRERNIMRNTEENPPYVRTYVRCHHIECTYRVVYMVTTLGRVVPKMRTLQVIRCDHIDDGNHLREGS